MVYYGEIAIKHNEILEDPEFVDEKVLPLCSKNINNSGYSETNSSKPSPGLNDIWQQVLG